jgi:hypothetical protein
MKRILSCSVLALFSACKTTPKTSLQSVSVKPTALIGTAYDAVTQEFTGVSCLDISALTASDYEQRSLGEFSSALRQETEVSELEAVFAAFQNSFYASATGLRLSRPYETVQHILESDREVVKLTLVQSERGVLRFRPESRSKLRLLPEAQRHVQQILIATGEERKRLVDAFIQNCGTGFLAGTHYKLGMAATLRWIFNSPDDKKRWEAELREADQETWAETQSPRPPARLRYESHMKETRDLNFKILGEIASKDCSPDAYGPCLDAFRLFLNASVPSWQQRVSQLADDFDAILPQSFLSDPEVIPYHEIEPALEGIALEPNQEESMAWKQARDRFVAIHARVFRELQLMERMGEKEQALQLKTFLQQISNEAAPCYRPQLRRDLCLQRSDQLSKELVRMGLFQP